MLNLGYALIGSDSTAPSGDTCAFPGLLTTFPGSGSSPSLMSAETTTDVLAFDQRMESECGGTEFYAQFAYEAVLVLANALRLALEKVSQL